MRLAHIMMMTETDRYLLGTSPAFIGRSHFNRPSSTLKIIEGRDVTAAAGLPSWRLSLHSTSCCRHWQR